MDMENYNNTLVSNASFSIVENRKKYYGLCKEVINRVCSITTEQLLQEVTFPTVQDLYEEAERNNCLQNGLGANLANGGQSNHVGNQNMESMDICINGTDGKEKNLEIINNVSELVGNYDILENMILKSHNNV